MKSRYYGLSIFLVLFLLLGMLVLGGCDTTAPPVDDDDDENGVPDTPEVFKTLTVCLTDMPQTNDWANYRHRNTQTVMRNWTDALMQRDPQSNFYAPWAFDLAESFEIIEDNVVKVTIRDNIIAHDGSHITVDDFIFSGTRQFLPGGMEGEDAPRRRGNTMEAFEKIDDYTFLITYLQPLTDPTHPPGFVNFDVFPKAYFEEVGLEGFLEHPKGVGPFKWVEGDFTTRIVLERFEDYSGDGAHLPGEVDRVPALDRVIFVAIAEPTTRVAALLAGDVDVIQAVPSDMVRMLHENPDTQIVSTPGTAMMLAYFNVTKAPFNDKRVRQAVGYAINSQEIVDDLYSGFATVKQGHSLMMPAPHLDVFQKVYDAVKSPYSYDPEKAKALLAEAGVSDLSIIIDTSAAYLDQTQLIAQYLGDIGIDASVRVWEASVLTEQFQSAGRDMMVGQIGIGGKHPGWIDGTLATGQPVNFSGYSNPIIDELSQLMWTLPHDDPRLIEVCIEGHEIVMEEAPIFCILVPDVIEATRSHVINYWPAENNQPRLHKVDILVD